MKRLGMLLLALLLILTPVMGVRADGDDDPGLQLQSLGISPFIIYGGQTTGGRVVITSPAHKRGVTVFLSTNNPAVIVPSSVFIPKGVVSVLFTINTSPVLVRTTVIVTASYGGVTKTALVVLRPY